MPAILAMLLGGLINIAGTVAGRVLLSLGIGVVTYTGLSAGMDALKSQLFTAFSGLPPDLAAILFRMKIGPAIGIVLAAIAARMALNGLTGDTFKRFVHR